MASSSQRYAAPTAQMIPGPPNVKAMRTISDSNAMKMLASMMSPESRLAFAAPTILEPAFLACGFLSCGKKDCAIMKKCGGCKNIVYCSTACQRGDWSNHRSECKRLSLHREVAKKTGHDHQFKQFTFDTREELTMSSASGLGNLSIYRSEDPDRGPPHALTYADTKHIMFRRVEELDPMLQFLICCGITNDVTRAEEVLPQVLKMLPCQSLWHEEERWEGIADVAICGTYLRALEWAARKGHREIVEWLCTDPRTAACVTAGCPVGWACYTDHVEIARLLVRYGANSACTDVILFAHKPPLLAAAENGSAHAMKWLVDEMGHDLHIRAPDGTGVLEHIYQVRKVLSQHTGVPQESIELNAPLKACLAWAVERGVKAVAPYSKLARIVAGLKASPLHETVALEILGDLSNLLRVSAPPTYDVVHEFVQAEGVQALLQAQVALGRSRESVAIEVCSSLNVIANANQLQPRLSLAIKQAISKATYDALEAHPSSLGVAFYSMLTVICLSYKLNTESEADIVRMGTEGALDKVLATLQAHARDAGVSVQCLIALQNLTQCEANKRRLRAMRAAGKICVCTVLCKALAVSSNWVPSESLTVSVSEATEELLLSLVRVAAWHRDAGAGHITTEALGEANVVPYLIATLRLYPSHEKKQEYLLDIVQSLATSHSIRFCELGGVQLLAVALEQHAGSEGVVGAAAGVLSNVAAIRSWTPKLGVTVKPLLAALQRHQSPHVLGNGCGAVRNLACDRDHPAKLLACGACQIVIGALKALPNNREVVTKACQAVGNLCAHSPSRALLLSLGAQKLLERAMENPAFAERRPEGGFSLVIQPGLYTPHQAALDALTNLFRF